ncbi:hypothetical protein C442_17905 [Haloarcula amylolytica JCM 13557]|uniref:Uncharacterized protein n=1 Tax=Haloarcula amylolytica JCM 13557 TaxID=1227452 RepID=M0KAI0_9EURY|nr:hypothetical protein C442_17905 [Haloarcula amylolytica JCM 13557]
MKELTDVRQRDLQAVLKMIGWGITSIGCLMISSWMPLGMAVMWISVGIMWQLSARRFDPDRMVIRYDFDVFS